MVSCGVSPHKRQEIIGTNTGVVIISEDTAMKQRKRYPDLKDTAYILFQEILENGNWKKSQAKENHFIIEYSIREEKYKAVIKILSNTNEIFLQSLSKKEK